VSFWIHNACLERHPLVLVSLKGVQNNVQDYCSPYSLIKFLSDSGQQFRQAVSRQNHPPVSNPARTKKRSTGAACGCDKEAYSIIDGRKLSKASAIQFYAFDILIDRGRSLLAVPLETRRELLNEALHAVSDPIRLSEAFGKENNAYPGYPKRPKRKRRCGKQLHQEIHVRATMAESDK
jgi:hypothetical protein